MMNKYPYFKTPSICIDGSPPPAPLSCTVKRKVRFEEVDLLQIVWHGHYASYFEDARVAFGDKYGIGYTDLYQKQIATPLKKFFVDYAAPLRFGDTCSITAILHWSDAARINFSYIIHDMQKKIVTTGYTVQLFLTPQGELYMEHPAFYAKFCQKWKNGDFN